jgi:hypothetical protein
MGVSLGNSVFSESKKYSAIFSAALEKNRYSLRIKPPFEKIKAPEVRRGA